MLTLLLIVPLTGVICLSTAAFQKFFVNDHMEIKIIALTTSLINIIISLIILIFYDFSLNHFQFLQDFDKVKFCDFYSGLDGISIYFVLVTTIITPIALLSNWSSIKVTARAYAIIILLLETLLLAVFLLLDVFLFYIFFESILPPLFILIGLFGSNERVRASFYLFLYTLLPLKCVKAKYRGNPKALVIKVIKEILLLAWLMFQGTVISLVFISEKHHISGVDTWAITVLNYFCFIADSLQTINYKSVKEQRVDSYSNSRNLDFVRCTLVAGKPVFGRKIYSRFGNNIIVNNMSKRFIHNKRSILDPWFITGIIDAEGCFLLGVFKSDNYRMGYQIQAIFKITLHKKDLDLLCQIQDYFKVGKITNHGDTTLQYTVKSLKDLEIIISHFDKYSLLGQKRVDYLLFKNAISLLKNKEHLNKEGFKKLLSIRASMNLGLSDELKLSFPDVKPISPKLSLGDSSPKKIINLNWIAGLASGDGCFHVSIRNSATTKLGKAVVLKFHIVQHSRDFELIQMLIDTLGCGRVELTLKQSAVYFVVTDFKNIFEKIIPLFDKYPIKGIKSLDYCNFKEIANLMNNKEHLTEQGLSNIHSIKLNMNFFRKL